MGLEEFEREYTKKKITLNGVNFIINKMPAFSSAFIFIKLIKKLFGEVATLPLTNDSADNTKSIILGLVAGLDVEYLEDELMPALFSHVIFSCENKGLKLLNLQELKVSIESELDFDSILELLVRAICVNFGQRILERISIFRTKQT